MRLKERQRDILGAALDLLAQGGSRALTTRNLAARLGITEPAIYRHFSCKKELLLALYGYVWEVLEGRLASSLDGVEGAVERLKVLLLSVLSFLEKNKGVNLVLLSEAIYRDDPQLKAALWKVFRGIQGMVEGILESGTRDGILRDDVDRDLVARTVMGFVQVNLTAHLLSGEVLDVEALVEGFLRVLLEGVKR